MFQYLWGRRKGSEILRIIGVNMRFRQLQYGIITRVRVARGENADVNEPGERSKLSVSPSHW